MTYNDIKKKKSFSSSDTQVEETLVSFLYDITEVSAVSLTDPTKLLTDFDCQLFAQLLQHVYVLFNRREVEGKRVTDAARHYGRTKVPIISEMMRTIVYTNPLLAIYWCQLLVVLDFDDATWWKACGLDITRKSINSGQDIARRGAFLLHCELLANSIANEDKDDEVLKVFWELELEVQEEQGWSFRFWSFTHLPYCVGRPGAEQ